MSIDFLTILNNSELRLQQQNLPLLAYRETILDNILSNQSLIIQADTGLGKTTQIPQYLFLNSYFENYQIFCTQPRRIAAACVARRVNDEFGCTNIVNSCLNYRDLSRIHESPIVYFSECNFLNYILTEIYNDNPLPTCRALILDEAHERNIETDVILALTKKYILPKRKDFKLIITSATLQLQILSKYLNCPVIICEGSAYPVKEIFIRKYDNYFYETVNLATRVIQGKLSANTQKETILIFLSGFDEINGAKYIISKKIISEELEIQILYGHLEFKEQQEIVNTQNRRIRVVISTNIAESSLTVPGVTCVIDSGREKVASGTQYKDFRVRFITKMSAIQRKGRAGRTNPGICYRIYTEDEFSKMVEFREPAILRSNIGLLTLKFLKFGLFNIESLPLLDSPDPVAQKDTYEELINLEMLSISSFNTYKVTEIGKFALELDIMPMLGKFIFGAYHFFECGDEATMLSALFLCVDFVFLRSESIEEEIDLREKYLLCPQMVMLGDMISSLFTFRQYYALLCDCCINRVGDCSCSETKKLWSQKFFICEKKFKSALRQYDDLLSRLEEKFSQQVFYFSEKEWLLEKQLALMSLEDFDSDNFKSLLDQVCVCYKEFYENYFQNAVISGFFQNLAQYRGDNIIDAGYLYVSTKEIVVPHPCSPIGKLLFSNPPKYIVFFEISVTTNLFMKYISPVDISKTKKLCESWLKKINFSEEIEPLSGLVFQNLGPAYMKELLGMSGTKIYDVETELKKKGAQGILILPDPMRNSLKLRVPQPYRKIAEDELRKVLDYKQKEVLRKNIVQIPYSKGIVLVVTPGGVISEIMYSEDTLVYHINDLKNYQSYNEALLDIQNTFEFYQFNLVRKQGDAVGVIYFKSQAQADEAQQSLKQRPLIGKSGPILNLIPVQKSASQPCLKVSAAIYPQQLRAMLEYYGEFRSIYIKPLGANTLAFVRYMTQEATESCLYGFNQWVEEEYGIYSSVFRLQDGILIPKELIAIGIDIVNYHLEKISMEYGVEIHLSGKEVVRVYGELHKLPNDAMEQILDLVNCETVPVTHEVIKTIDKSLIPMENGEEVSWKVWQEIHQVNCNYLYYRSALAVYGMPQDRQYAVKQIQKMISNILKQLFTVEITYTSIKELRKIEVFKKRFGTELQVDININRRKGSFTITGIKYFVDRAIEKLNLQDKCNIVTEACGICIQNFTENSICLSLCGHRFHSGCLNLQIKNAISEAGMSGFPINCIICSHPLVHNDWSKVLSYSELLNLFSASVIQFISKNPVYSHCENPNCDYVYNIEKTSLLGNTRKCIRCRGNYCIKCNKQVFGLGHEIQCEIDRMRKFDKENMAWIEQNTTGCPKCSLRIEKNKGCNHVVCLRCDTHFCFICKEQIFDQYPVDHYRDPNRICYQRYMID